MTKQREQRIKSLFGQVADMPRKERFEYLNRACDDVGMIDEVLALCEGDEEANERDFWEKGVWVIKSSADRRKKMIGEIIRGYRIIKDLTTGGMGEVYLAQRADGLLKDRSKAVIKILGAHLLKGDKIKKEMTARFIGEIEIQYKLKHPNIAQIFDADLLDDGRPFMILEYAEGQSLREMLSETTSLPIKDVVEITQQICAGLAEAHNMTITHRDLKPENIIVHKSDDKYKVKIIDFGVALAQESGILPTRLPTTTFIGTPEYAAPEQLMPKKFFLKEPGEKPGRHADIYSLGVIIYEMMTGRRPFLESGQEVALKHVTEEPDAPSKVRPDLNIPEAVDKVVLKALAKMPGSRQETTEQLAQELKAAIESKPGPEVVIQKTDPLKPDTARKQPQLDRRKFLWALPVTLAVAVASLLYGSQLWKVAPIGGDGGQPTPAVAASPVSSQNPTPSPAALVSAMTVSVVRQDKRGRVGIVSPDTTFYSGERVKVSIQAAQSGFVYILQQGTSGKVSLLYPDPLISGGSNQIAKGLKVTIPSGNGWFRFNDDPGSETVYVLFSTNRTEGLMDSIERSVAKDGPALVSQLDKQAVDLSATGGILSGQGMLVGVLKLRHQL